MNAPVRVPSRPRRSLGRAVLAARAAALAGLLAVAPGAAEAAPAADLAPGSVTIALTALEDDGGRGPCRATLRIRNDGGVRVETFSLRLVLFDPGGAVLREVVVLAMPLRPGGRTTAATFPALAAPCDGLGAVVIRDFPLCADRAGRRLACRAAAVPVSRVVAPFGF
ncbi:hypothetical protein [Roseospira goensis]|uniref:Tat pathway signal protein n=1 Tax=Roseospira goensis TaxID=391922 RepID=A0A7W6S1M9_9PROT|nr:hypothetical protein [Roseospira goensis]MBB4287271.1 hypothetical protein [Roseospira goensis]